MDLIQVSNGKAVKIKSDKMQLGELFEFPHYYTTKHIELMDNESYDFYLFSDGVTDLIGGPDNKRLKMKNLKTMLEGVNTLSMEHQKITLQKQLMKWAGVNLPTDDLLMVGISV